MTFQQDQHQHQEEQQQPSSSAAGEELDNLINELVNNNLLKVRELLFKIDTVSKKEGLDDDEIDIIIHQRYVDAIKKKKIMMVEEEDKTNNNNNNRSPYYQYYL